MASNGNAAQTELARHLVREAWMVNEVVIHGVARYSRESDV
jgi:hypothetical protein